MTELLKRGRRQLGISSGSRRRPRRQSEQNLHRDVHVKDSVPYATLSPIRGPGLGGCSASARRVMPCAPRAADGTNGNRGHGHLRITHFPLCYSGCLPAQHRRALALGLYSWESDVRE